jgi:hypothetical protein
MLLFFSGFELAAQVVANHMQWMHLDWSFQLLSWIASVLIYQLGKRFNTSIMQS